MYGYIYLTTNLINNKKYIGKHKGYYDKNYFGSGLLITKALNKYGTKNFKVDILKYCYTLKELNYMEKYYIDLYNACESNKYYNIASGGDGGNLIYGYTKEQMQAFKDKMSKITSRENNGMYGKKHNIISIEKMSIARKESIDKYKTKEFREKMSEVTSGSKNGMYGKKHSKKSLELMSINSKGKSSGCKNGMHGKKGENAINGVKVFMFDKNRNLIKVFNTKRLALEYIGTESHSGLNKAIKNNKLYKGYYWKQNK